MSSIKFDNQKRIFFNTINEDVEQYFKEKQLLKSGNYKLYIKSIILVSIALSLYIILLTIKFNPFVSVILCCVFGLAQAGIGFNVMHDANHGSYSEKKWINNFLGLSANSMGVSAWFWKQKHNIVHHTYTNIDGVDEDIAKSPFLRMCPSQKRFKAHRFQYIYCIPMYALSSLMMIIGDFRKYFSKKILVTKLWKMDTSEHISFWLTKLLYLFLFLILPTLILGIIPAIIGFAIMHAVLGLTLAIVFQLAHVVEATHFIAGNETVSRIESEWAIHQVRTTANFATESKVVSWFTGGLNYQVEHHLFPKISHIHYPVIHKFVIAACQKHGVAMNNYPSMFSAVRSHFRFMKKLGID